MNTTEEAIKKGQITEEEFLEIPRALRSSVMRYRAIYKMSDKLTREEGFENSMYTNSTWDGITLPGSKTGDLNDTGYVKSGDDMYLYTVKAMELQQKEILNDTMLAFNSSVCSIGFFIDVLCDGVSSWMTETDSVQYPFSPIINGVPGSICLQFAVCIPLLPPGSWLSSDPQSVSRLRRLVFAIDPAIYSSEEIQLPRGPGDRLTLVLMALRTIFKSAMRDRYLAEVMMILSSKASPKFKNEDLDHAKLIMAFQSTGVQEKFHPTMEVREEGLSMYRKTMLEHADEMRLRNSSHVRMLRDYRGEAQEAYMDGVISGQGGQGEIDDGEYYDYSDRHFNFHD